MEQEKKDENKKKEGSTSMASEERDKVMGGEEEEEEEEEEMRGDKDFMSVWVPTYDVLSVEKEGEEVDDIAAIGLIESGEKEEPSIPPNLVMKTVIETLDLAPELLDTSRIESDEYRIMMQDLGYMEGLKSMDPYLAEEDYRSKESMMLEEGEEMVAVESQEMEKLMKEVWMMGEISIRGGRADPMILRLSYAVNEIKEVGRKIKERSMNPYEPLEKWIQDIARMELRYSAIVKETIQYIDEIKRQGTIKLKETIDLL